MPDSIADISADEVLRLLGDIPFAVTRRVRWGDCDPAGVIHTPRITYFALETIEDFQVALTGGAWGAMLRERGMGAPSVRTECAYLKPPRVEQVLRVSLRLERIGGASVTYLVEGLDDDGIRYFRVRHVACYVDNDTFKPMPIPDDIRGLLEAYDRAAG